MQHYGLDWLGTFLGLASIYYIGRRDQAAFGLRIAASVFWAAFGFVVHSPATVFANSAAILLCLRGLSILPSRRPRDQQVPGRGRPVA